MERLRNRYTTVIQDIEMLIKYNLLVSDFLTNPLSEVVIDSKCRKDNRFF